VTFFHRSGFVSSYWIFSCVFFLLRIGSDSGSGFARSGSGRFARFARFARSGLDRFEGVAWTQGLGGVPLLEGCAAYLECSTEQTFPGGDHLMFLGRVERVVSAARRPLAYGSGKYMVVHPYDNLASKEMGSGHVATLNAIHLARPCLEDLSRETDKTVGLGVWGNCGPTLIWWVEAKKPLDVRLRCGMVLPLLGSATGKVFAAFSSRSITQPYLDAEIEASHINDSSEFVNHFQVDQYLSQIRVNKIADVQNAILPGINEKGVNGYSVPVFDASGEIVLALTMMGEADSLVKNDPVLQSLKDAAQRLSARLGWKS
jgi:DNA-binding IclR family transcriptional regulator